MRLSKENQYSYNRYMDSLSVKASEIFSLQNEAEFKIKEDIAIKLINKKMDNQFISDATGLSYERIEELRIKNN